MTGHKICFYGEIWLIPKLFLLIKSTVVLYMYMIVNEKLVLFIIIFPVYE